MESPIPHSVFKVLDSNLSHEVLVLWWNTRSTSTSSILCSLNQSSDFLHQSSDLFKLSQRTQRNITSLRRGLDIARAQLTQIYLTRQKSRRGRRDRSISRIRVRKLYIRTARVGNHQYAPGLACTITRSPEKACIYYQKSSRLLLLLLDTLTFPALRHLGHDMISGGVQCCLQQILSVLHLCTHACA